MDPADTEAIRKAIAAQRKTLRRHDQGLQEVMEAIRSLSTHVTQLRSQLSHVTSQLATAGATSAPPSFPAQEFPEERPPLSLCEPFIPTLQPYAGDLGSCVN